MRVLPVLAPTATLRAEGSAAASGKLVPGQRVLRQHEGLGRAADTSKRRIKLRAFPLWKAHQLTGDRKGVWSLHVTRNWRLTFQIKDGEILDVDYEDYH